MDMYTYCSYMGATKGYQYAKIKKSAENQSFCNVESEKGNIPVELKQWFENKTDWKMVLQKEIDSQNGWLLISSLEAVIDIENQRKIEAGIEIEQANKFRKNKKIVEVEGLQKVQTYINFAIYADIRKLFKMAIGVLAEFEKDLGREIYKDMEEGICHSSDDCYYVNGNQIHVVLERLTKEGEAICPSSYDTNERRSQFGFLKKFEVSKKLVPCIKRQGKDKKEKVADIIKDVPAPQKFSSNNMIYVAENEQIEKYGSYNIALSYNFFRRGY